MNPFDEIKGKYTGQLPEQLHTDIDAFRQLMTYYSCAILEVETKLNVLNRQFSAQKEYNPIETIKSRLKSPESIIEKMVRRGLPMTPEGMAGGIDDIAGVRVICPFINDIYLVANCLKNQDDIKVLGWKDYIQNPKDNGYRSLHIIVETPIYLLGGKRMMKVEIQLRTIAMDFWASLDHRLRYKKLMDQPFAESIEEELRDCAEQSAALDWQMETIKSKIYGDANLDSERRENYNN